MDQSEQKRRAIRFVVTLWAIAFALSFPVVWIAAVIGPENRAVLMAVFLAVQVPRVALAVYAGILAILAEKAGVWGARFGWLPVVLELLYRGYPAIAPAQMFS